MNALEVYSNLGLPDNFQKHMLRVAAFASVILDNWKGEPVDSKSVIATTLFHDVAKPITLDLSKQSQFIANDIELRRLNQVRNNLIAQYGTDEHEALRLIFKDLGLSQNSIRIIDNLEWNQSDRLIGENDQESLIGIYSDMRVGPHGVLLLVERLRELNSRRPIENFELRSASAQRLEEHISSKTSIKLNEIDDALIQHYLPTVSNVTIGP